MADPREGRLLRAAVLVIDGPDEGQRFTLEPGRSLRVGRGLDSDAVLSDKSVSRNHVEFVASERGLLAQDMGSNNGTLLNGSVIVAPTFLKQYDRVEVGFTVLRVELVREEVAEDTAPRAFVPPDVEPLPKTVQEAPPQARTLPPGVVLTPTAVMAIPRAGGTTNAPRTAGVVPTPMPAPPPGVGSPPTPAPAARPRPPGSIPTPVVSRAPTPVVSRAPTPAVSRAPTPAVSRAPTPAVVRTPAPAVVPAPVVARVPTPAEVPVIVPTPVPQNAAALTPVSMPLVAAEAPPLSPSPAPTPASQQPFVHAAVPSTPSQPDAPDVSSPAPAPAVFAPPMRARTDLDSLLDAPPDAGHAPSFPVPSAPDLAWVAATSDGSPEYKLGRKSGLPWVAILVTLALFGGVAFVISKAGGKKSTAQNEGDEAAATSRAAKTGTAKNGGDIAASSQAKEAQQQAIVLYAKREFAGAVRALAGIGDAKSVEMHRDFGRMQALVDKAATLAATDAVAGFGALQEARAIDKRYGAAHSRWLDSQALANYQTLGRDLLARQHYEDARGLADILLVERPTDPTTTLLLRALDQKASDLVKQARGTKPAEARALLEHAKKLASSNSEAYRAAVKALALVQ